MHRWALHLVPILLAVLRGFAFPVTNMEARSDPQQVRI